MSNDKQGPLTQVIEKSSVVPFIEENAKQNKPSKEKGCRTKITYFTIQYIVNIDIEK